MIRSAQGGINLHVKNKQILKMNWLTGLTSMAETLGDKIGSHRHSLSNQLNDEKAGYKRD